MVCHRVSLSVRIVSGVSIVPILVFDSLRDARYVNLRRL